MMVVLPTVGANIPFCVEAMNQYDQTYRVVAEIVTIQAMWQLRIEILCKY